jgi:hypothetical protein
VLPQYYLRSPVLPAEALYQYLQYHPHYLEYPEPEHLQVLSVAHLVVVLPVLVLVVG